MLKIPTRLPNYVQLSTFTKLNNDLEKKRRRLWVAFVRTKRAKWSPTANSRLCSQHFQTEDFESPFVTIPGTDFVSRSVLRKGAVPSIHKTPEPSNYDKHGQSQDSVDPTHPSSTRKHRRAVRELLKENVAKTSEAEASTSTTSTTDEPGLVDDQTVTSDSLYPVQQPLSTEEASCQTPECLGCKKLKSQNRQLCNKIIDLKLKIQVKEAAIQKQKESIDESMAKVAAMEEKLEDETFVSSDEEMDIEEEPDYSEVSSPEHSLASGTESAPEADLSESDLSSDDEEPQNKLFPTVHLYWKKYQEKMMAKLKATEQSLVIAGDGRHDSMGHSAKYCAYTLFCCTVPLIIDFSLVQLQKQLGNCKVNGKSECCRDKNMADSFIDKCET
ncbi:THAP domain-containing 10 [Paramuricea clavata]|uniref:THAP domain-containing 10 n=1 Tax=Paramuricea clavata TaxID=317549 RepID=A0A6S7ICG5_PARCT|nr:THAP domain-containing 10 [Paramuricea clavata]